MKIQTPPKRNTRFTKLISVALALALWFYVAGQGQMSAQYSAEVDLNYIKLGDNLAVSGPDKVTVKMWGTVTQTEQLEEAYVDLSGLGPGTYTLPVSLQQSNRALLAKVEPDKVKVMVAELQENQIAIVPQNQQELAAGFELTDIFTVPEVCTVQGELSAVARVHTVLAPVSLVSSSEMQNYTVGLLALDDKGEPVKEIRMIPGKVIVYAVVSQRLIDKQLPIKAAIEGQAAEGFEIGEITIEPREALLAGSADVVDKLNQIRTKPVDISGSSKSLTIKADLEVPEGIKVYPVQVEVTIGIDPIPEPPGGSEEPEEPEKPEEE